MKLTSTNNVTKHQLENYVTKREFHDFVEEMRDFRTSTEERFTGINKRFDGIDRRFDRLEQTMETKHVALIEQFDHLLSTGLEFLQNEIEKIIEKKMM